MRKLSPVTFAVSLCLGVNGLTAIASEQNEDQQKIIITGSHIKRIEQESASPIVTLSKDDIARSGATTLSGLLETTVLHNGGALNNQQTGGFTPGAASYNLRGLRSDRTLVLVDGRRLASYPFGQNGSVAFVDLNSIPLGEVESVEILKDGASAAYGSDAISGVVNVITRRSFEGHQTKVKVQQSDSDYEGKFVSYVGGFSDENNDLVLVAEYQDYTALLGKDFVPGSQLTISDASAYSFPGTYITQDANSNLVATPAPGCSRSENADEFFVDVAGTVCLNDWAGDRQLIPENERKSLAAKWSRYISDSTVYSSISFNQIDTKSDVPFGFVSSDFFIAQDNQFNPINQDMLYLRGFSEVGLQTIETEAQNINFVVGMEGLISEYDFDISLSHSLTKVDEIYADGWMHQDSATALVQAINNGEINPFQPLTAEQIGGYTSQFNHNGESDQTSLIGRLSGEITELESGIVYFASGVEFRKESIEDTSDQAIIDGDVVGLGSSSAKGDRNVSALFGEVIVPITEEIELNAAVRFDDYSDFGSSVNPKISMKYRPSELVLLRASYGAGFRAPNLFELYTDEVTGSVGDVPFIQVANADLEAETSESFNFGIVFDIDERFMASFDFWKIDVEDMITNLGVQAILTEVDENDNLVYSDFIVRNPDDSIAYVIDPFLNLDSQMAQGVDFAARLSFTKNAELQINISHLAELTQTTRSSGVEQNLEGTYLFPENRFNANLILGTDNFKHVLSGYYTAEHGNENFSVDGYFKADYQLTYTYGDHQFNLMVANLFDEEPPINELGQWPYFEQRMYSPLGRNFSLTWTYDI